MKIGIMTFHFAHNYGAMLQCYALKNFLEENGHDVSVIPYQSDIFYRRYCVKPFVLKRNPINSVKNFIQYFSKREQAELFNSFMQNELGIVAKRLPDGKSAAIAALGYDMIIVGSDQVWNKNITKNDNTYFGKGYADKVKTISYAASMGDYLKLSDETTTLLRKFRSISVRENDAENALRNCNLRAELSVDPVFLLSRDNWSAIAAKSCQSGFPSGSYIVYYTLQEPQELIDKTRTIAAEMKLPIYIISGNLKKSTMQGNVVKNAGPAEFIWFIQNAEYVCTDSFHALAFSIIFNKRIFIVPHAKTGSRMKHLLRYINIESTNDVIDCNASDKSGLHDAVSASKNYLIKNTSASEGE